MKKMNISEEEFIRRWNSGESAIPISLDCGLSVWNIQSKVVPEMRLRGIYLLTIVGRNPNNYLKRKLKSAAKPKRKSKKVTLKLKPKSWELVAGNRTIKTLSVGEHFRFLARRNAFDIGVCKRGDKFVFEGKPYVKVFPLNSDRYQLATCEERVQKVVKQA